MSSKKSRAENTATARVDRASVAVRRAIGRLVQLLGEEDDVVIAAAVALVALGARAVVGPLAAALPRATTQRHRAGIIMTLGQFAQEERGQVVRALRKALERESDPVFALGISQAFSIAMMSGLIEIRPPGSGDRSPGLGPASVSSPSPGHS